MWEEGGWGVLYLRVIFTSTFRVDWEEDKITTLKFLDISSFSYFLLRKMSNIFIYFAIL